MTEQKNELRYKLNKWGDKVQVEWGRETQAGAMNAITLEAAEEL